MSTIDDPLIGTWKLNPSRCEFDVNHHPQSATLVIEHGKDGGYLLTAHGISEEGEPVVEKPQTLIPDGQPRPVPDFPGLAVTSECPEASILQTVVRRKDGSIVGQGTYTVSADRQLLTAITSGFDSQLRQFEQRTSWDKEEVESPRGRVF
jgi:hypothetical protein